MAKVNKSESKQNPAIKHRDEEHEDPCPQLHQGYLLHHEVSSEKVRNYQQLPRLTPIPMPISRPSSSESLHDSILYKSEIVIRV